MKNNIENLGKETFVRGINELCGDATTIEMDELEKMTASQEKSDADLLADAKFKRAWRANMTKSERLFDSVCDLFESLTDELGDWGGFVFGFGVVSMIDREGVV